MTTSCDQVISKLRANNIYSAIVPINVGNSGYFISNRITDANISAIINTLGIEPGISWEIEIAKPIPGNFQLFIAGPPGQTVAFTGIIMLPMAGLNVFTITATTTGINTPIPISPPTPLSGISLRIVAIEPTIPDTNVELRATLTIAL